MGPARNATPSVAGGPGEGIRDMNIMSKTMPEPTLQDLSNKVDTVIDTVNTAFTAVAVEIHGIKEEIGGMKQDIANIKDTMVTKEGLKEELAKMVTKEDLKQELSKMVTKEDLKKELVKVVSKEYLDDKLSDLKGDLTVIIRKEDRKVVALIDELRQTKVLSEPAARRILGLEPFPQS